MLTLKDLVKNCVDNPFLTGDALVDDIVSKVESRFELIDRKSFEGIQKKVMDYFNLVKFKYLKIHMDKRTEIKLTSSRKRMINARVKEGYCLDDFKMVIDFKFKQWFGTEYQVYLSPETLFQPSKFVKYLEAAKDRQYRDQGLTEKVRMALANPTRLQFLKLTDEEMLEFEKRSKAK